MAGTFHFPLLSVALVWCVLLCNKKGRVEANVRKRKYFGVDGLSEGEMYIRQCEKISLQQEHTWFNKIIFAAWFFFSASLVCHNMFQFLYIFLRQIFYTLNSLCYSSWLWTRSCCLATRSCPWVQRNTSLLLWPCTQMSSTSFSIFLLSLEEPGAVELEQQIESLARNCFESGFLYSWFLSCSVH